MKNYPCIFCGIEVTGKKPETTMCYECFQTWLKDQHSETKEKQLDTVGWETNL